MADELAGAICFPLGHDSRYVTGAVLRVDGGHTIALPKCAGGMPRGERHQ